MVGYALRLRSRLARSLVHESTIVRFVEIVLRVMSVEIVLRVMSKVRAMGSRDHTS